MLVKGFLEDLGCKARLVSTGGNPVVYGEYDVGADPHSPCLYKAWVDSPVWRFIQALASMTSKDGNKVLIDGFYNDVKVPTEEDLELLEKLRETFNEELFKQTCKVERFIDDRGVLRR